MLAAALLPHLIFFGWFSLIVSDCSHFGGLSAASRAMRCLTCLWIFMSNVGLQHDRQALLEAQPAPGSKVGKALAEICNNLFGTTGWPAEGLVPIGFHGDGVPIQGTIRKESLDFMTINLPGSKLHRDLRVPFTVLQTKFHFQYQTKKAILEILLWSLDHLKNGMYHSCRHDGTAWLTTDKARSRLRGQLPARGTLAEIRGLGLAQQLFQHTCLEHCFRYVLAL